MGFYRGLEQFGGKLSNKIKENLKNKPCKIENILATTPQN